jgi:hypothetical protein
MEKGINRIEFPSIIFGCYMGESRKFLIDLWRNALMGRLEGIIAQPSLSTDSLLRDKP